MRYSRHRRNRKRHVDLEALLQNTVDPGFRHATPLKPKVHVWTRLKPGQLHGAASEERFEAFKLLRASGASTLLVIAHLKSKVGREPDRELEDAKEFAASLRGLRKEVGSAAATLVVGDLNLHPWDNAMRYPDALNAVASRLMTANPSRPTRGGVAYERFYNPAWNLLSDANGPPGTHFWHEAPVGPTWYVLDQVLLRPGLVPRFRLPSLRVVTTIGTRNLLSAGGGLPRNGSDHLPLTFALEI